MLTARLDVQMQLGRIQVNPARLDLDIQSTAPIQSSQIQISKPRLEISSAEATKIDVSTRAIQSELGFRRPKELTEEGKSRAKNEAQSAVSRITSEGDQYLNDPKGATTSIAKSTGVYSPSVQLAAIPKNRPIINIGEPGKVAVDFQEGRVDVFENSQFSIDFNYRPPTTTEGSSTRIDISVVPVSPPRLNIDLQA
ncbi:MAG: DUF6470 family protein [bacterium]|nr:DUF6470 family protein [bacterium]